MSLLHLNKSDKTVAVLFGAMPHSNPSSELFMQNAEQVTYLSDGYPPFIRLSAEGSRQPKITKHSLYTGLEVLQKILSLGSTEEKTA